MRYMGGKSKLANKLTDSMPFYPCFGEPFAGACNVTSAWCSRYCHRMRYYVVQDIFAELIEMWRCAVVEGWQPPSTLTEQEYRRWRLEKKLGPEKVFVGFGASFGGKWYGGFAREGDNSANPRELYPESFNHFCLKQSAMSKVKTKLKFVGGDYERFPGNFACYCDPPYEGTTNVGSRKVEFDSDRFWKWVRSRRLPTYVSELTAPKDFVVVAEYKYQASVRTLENERSIERLYLHKSQVANHNEACKKSPWHKNSIL